MFKLMIIIVAAIIFGLFAYKNFDETFGEDLPSEPELVACTTDAVQCPDGSYVGRSGSNCEFICPE